MSFASEVKDELALKESEYPKDELSALFKTSGNITISNGVVKFKVPYYTYTVNANGSVSRSGNNTYSETINATQNGSSIQLKFTITKNVAALTSSYTLNSLPTKVLVLDDIEREQEQGQYSVIIINKNDLKKFCSTLIPFL